MTETMMPVNGIEVCVETFGEPTDAPLLLLAGDASSMDWWDDEFCRRLAADGRFVVRYDHRDTGRSTCFPIGAVSPPDPASPVYSGADLLNDALGVLDVLGIPAAHLVGFSLGGGIAQRIAVEHPDRVLSLTLISTSAGSGDPNCRPTSGPAVASAVAVVTRTVPAADVDWTDRKAAVTHLIAEIRDRGGPFTAAEPQLRRLAERIFDRSADLAAGRLHHRLAGYGPPVRDRLAEIVAPTVILHGTLDQWFGPEHADELAAAIPGARLVWLDGVGHEFPPRAVWDAVLREILSVA